MTWWWRSALLLGALGAVPPLAAQGRVRRELGVAVLGRTAGTDAGFAALEGLLRPAPFTRVAAVAAGGMDAAGRGAARGEVLLHALFNPLARRGAGAYAGVGLGVEVAPAQREYLVLVAGIEGAPGGRGGWFVEGGVGGGVRVGAGWRWRWGGARN